MWLFVHAEFTGHIVQVAAILNKRGMKSGTGSIDVDTHQMGIRSLIKALTHWGRDKIDAILQTTF